MAERLDRAVANPFETQREFTAELMVRRLAAGGRRIRTLGPALEKASSAAEE
jgi:hypothetical protein